VSVEFLGKVARDFWVEYFGVLRGCENDWALDIEESAIEGLRLWVKMLKPNDISFQLILVMCRALAYA
jgi:hypothetical protein